MCDATRSINLTNLHVSHVTFIERVMSHVYTSHVKFMERVASHIYQSCHIHERVTPHVNMSHVTFMERVMSHVYNSHVASINESRPEYL